MAKFELSEPGTICLIMQEPNGRIFQLGITDEQSKMLQIILGSISKQSPLVKMGEEHDLVLKSTVKTFKK